MRFPGFQILLALALACLFACSSDPEPNNEPVCFVGDSITYGWDLEKHFPGLVTSKHAVAGAVVEDIDDWDVSDCKGKRTVFLMGINNIWSFTSDLEGIEEVHDYFGKLFVHYAASLGGKPLLYVSVMPRILTGIQDTLYVDNVRKQNAVVKHKLDSLGVDYHYVDVFDDFLVEGNVLDTSLFVDGLHPNEKGYEILTAKLKPYLY